MQKSFLFPGCGARLCAGQVFFFGQMACAPRGRAGGAGQVFSFGQMALRSARVRLRRGAGFFFWSNGFALRAGQSVGLVFSLSWCSRWWRGGCFLFWSNGFALRAGSPAAWGRFFLSVKWLCAPRGPERSFIKADCSLLMSKENQKTTSDFDALDPRERGCSPLSDPEGVVETEKS